MSTQPTRQKTKDIELPITFRDYQVPLFRAMQTKKRAIIVFHRRAGKDIACWNIMLIKALTDRVGSYYYIFPSFSQGRKAVWEAIDSDGRRFIDYIPRELIDGKPNGSEMKIRLKSGSIIRLLGSDDFDSIRGTNPVGVIFSEFAYQKPEVWYQVIEPALRLNGGWAIFNSTPYGKNHFYKLLHYAKLYPDEWFHQITTVEDTGLVKEEELKELVEQGISEETIAQEYYCSFDRGVEGSYYGRILHKIRKRGQIGTVHHDEYAKTYTAWDIGIGDSTAIWWWQLVGAGEIHFIDHYEASGESLAHYAKVIDEKGRENGYRYEQHFAPHDIRQRELGTGVTRLAIAEEAGVSFIVLPAKPVDTGIEMVRKLLHKCYFDEKKCKKGIEALESYQKRWDDKHRVYSSNPLHNWASHSADAMRYACTAIADYTNSSSMTADQLRDIRASVRNPDRDFL